MSHLPDILDIVSWDTHQALEHSRGYQTGREDVVHSSTPMTFTREHSRTFRLGYCQGWPEEKTSILIDRLPRGICGQSTVYASALAESEFAKIWEETSKLAECSDDEITD